MNDFVKSEKQNIHVLFGDLFDIWKWDLANKSRA